MIDTVQNLVNRFGLFVIGGLIGAIVHRLRNRMSWRKFIATLGISAFVGLSVGILLRNYFNAPEEVVFVACSVSGVFSKDLLDEVQQIIALLSDYIKQKLKGKPSS
tara:strand:+ start:1171 stop:1488 length:318 start_codon:yes stop_codon:yes gene_type:complete